MGVSYGRPGRTGLGRAHHEAVKVDLAAVPADVERIVFPVSLHDAENRGRSFGQVRNAFIRVVNQAGGAEIARHDLSEDASVGQGYASGLAGIAADFGVDV
ncbi:TerD family protein [Streptomyces chartreusis]|nr:TerD family protein [Streptomyces sp. WAC 01325]WCH92712.1 TerD family protein [Streptomyces moderatus]